MFLHPTLAPTPPFAPAPAAASTTEIFDIFNPKSFIYDDITNPQDALDEISRLKNNSSAYDEVMAEPILLEGNKRSKSIFL